MLGRIGRLRPLVGNKLGIVAGPVPVIPAFIIELTVNNRPVCNQSGGDVNRLFGFLTLCRNGILGWLSHPMGYILKTGQE